MEISSVFLAFQHICCYQCILILVDSDIIRMKVIFWKDIIPLSVTGSSSSYNKTISQIKQAIFKYNLLVTDAINCAVEGTRRGDADRSLI